MVRTNEVVHLPNESEHVCKVDVSSTSSWARVNRAGSEDLECIVSRNMPLTCGPRSLLGLLVQPHATLPDAPGRVRNETELRLSRVAAYRKLARTQNRSQTAPIYLCRSSLGHKHTQSGIVIDQVDSSRPGHVSIFGVIVAHRTSRLSKKIEVSVKTE